MTKRYLFLLAVASFILTVVWLVTNAYHSNTTTTIEPVLKMQIEPIEPGFDKNTIQQLRTRTIVQPANSANVVVTGTPENEPTPAVVDGLEQEISPTTTPQQDLLTPTISPGEEVAP